MIAKAGKPAARLVPIEPVRPQRRFGGLKGKVRIAEDFDAPLPDAFSLRSRAGNAHSA
ncbi:type II toxin-antitoxin system Phd/YefM family antitoxin [Burkholderia ubonensis]|uniref:type II toxin-antitoxin system Phd/YefM family antitoxin n=1 Tax=Burkholderia ubonensis TaxID=101571 RepID=UPI0039F5DDA0